MPKLHLGIFETLSDSQRSGLHTFLEIATLRDLLHERVESHCRGLLRAARYGASIEKVKTPANLIRFRSHKGILDTLSHDRRAGLMAEFEKIISWAASETVAERKRKANSQVVSPRTTGN